MKSAEAAAALAREPLPGPGAGTRDGTVNTHLTSTGGKLYALVEAGDLPVELDDELESVTRSDFGGALEAGFTAHPKFDPLTGLQHAITYEVGQPVRYVTLDPSGRAATLARIDLPHLPMIHDTAFTAASIVVLDLPVTFQPQRAQTDFPWLWDEQHEPRIGLLPRDGDLTGLKWFEAPRCFVFHILNAYDDGDRTMVDLVRHPRMFAAVQSAPGEGLPVLARWTLHRSSGRLDETILDDRGCEFPRINGAFGGRRYRFGYTALSGQTGFGPALKHDVERQTTELHDYGPGRATMEPVFVARAGAEAEDDGWIMSYVYDRERNLSDVVILDAHDFTGDPVATIHLSVRVPFGFHGGWAPDDPPPRPSLDADLLRALLDLQRSMAAYLCWRAVLFGDRKPVGRPVVGARTDNRHSGSSVGSGSSATRRSWERALESGRVATRCAGSWSVHSRASSTGADAHCGLGELFE